MVSNRRTLMAAAAIVLGRSSPESGVYFYVSGADKRAEDKVQFVEAFVATSRHRQGHDRRTEAVRRALIARPRSLRGSVPPSAVTERQRPRAARSRPVDDRTRSSTSPTPSFVAPAEGGRRLVRRTRSASKDLVAVTVTVDADRGVANQIAPGDHVDIAIDADDDGPALRYILQRREGARGRRRRPRPARPAATADAVAPPPASVRPPHLRGDAGPRRCSVIDGQQGGAASTWCCCP